MHALAIVEQRVGQQGLEEAVIKLDASLSELQATIRAIDGDCRNCQGSPSVSSIALTEQEPVIGEFIKLAMGYGCH